MHEGTAVRELIRVLEQTVQSQPVRKVLSVRLVVGELTGFMEESLRFYFETLPKIPELSGARLDITTEKPKMHCDSCGRDFIRARFSFDCPGCGKPGRLVDAGNRFFIDSIEVEES